MFLAWNYTLELFFWIVLGAIILISLTILLAGPRFRSKKPEISEETLLLTGESVDSPKGNIVNQDKVFSKIEEELEIPEENKEEEEVTRVGNVIRWLRKEWKNIVAYSGIIYSLIVCLFGILIIYEMISSEPKNGFRGVVDNIVGIYGCIVSLIGMAVVYSFLILKTRGNQKWLKYSCRVAAVVLSLLPFSYLIIYLVWNGYFCEDCNFPNSSEWGITGQYEEGIVFSICLVFASLLFSGDLKRIWKRVSSNENVKWDEQWIRLEKWVGNILKLLREKWMTLNTYTGIRYLLYLLFFLSVILFLAVLIFQFF